MEPDLDVPDDAPLPGTFRTVFRTYEVRESEEELVYVGEPLAAGEDIVETVWPLFREAGYEVSLDRRLGEYVLVATPHGTADEGVPWRNVALLLLTVLTTVYAGTGWYYVRDPLSPEILQALPFALAVMTVLGTHELGHYLASRYYDVEASLPYFIPMLPPIGTMGAVIRMRGRIPDRRALFDIGVAGPLAGLVATIVVTAVGLALSPIAVPAWVFDSGAISVKFGYPLLMRAIAAAMGEPLTYEAADRVLNPIVLGGWVGMFVTFLNLIPVGQLDGGHLVRAMIGPRQETVSAAVPAGLFGLAGYLYVVENAGSGAGIWVFWGLLTLVFAYVGSATPVHDREPLGLRRQLVGLATFGLGALCFMPVPIQIVAVS
ncbi:MAG: site-2 protease family protein [Halobacteriaceae archaeon]